MSDTKQTIDWENVKQMCQAEADIVHGEEPSIEKTHFRVGCMSGYKLAAPEIEPLRAENARLKAEVELLKLEADETLKNLQLALGIIKSKLLPPTNS